MRARFQNLRRYLPAVLVSLAAIGTPLLSAFEPVRGDEAAAIFPPGWSHADVVLATAEADLAFIRFGALSNIGIVRIVDDSSLAALRQAGALILLPPGALGGCLLPRAIQTPFDANASSIGIST
ncbi:hypothetical protein [Maricaulis salignorans]|uniref:hypothetical protein n=1 Tax=Maricaulis salignorans TaxID=144026 RepID=UPI003A8C9F41